MSGELKHFHQYIPDHCLAESVKLTIAVGKICVVHVFGHVVERFLVGMFAALDGIGVGLVD